MNNSNSNNLFEILLVEDSPADILMTRQALHQNKVANPLCVAEDGEQAIHFLVEKSRTSQLPGLILLDLNLPKKSGREVLEFIKADTDLLNIPVVVLTTSKDNEDVVGSYNLHANCYISKPMDFSKFVDVVKVIKEFWIGIATLPCSVKK